MCKATIQLAPSLQVECLDCIGVFGLLDFALVRLGVFGLLNVVQGCLSYFMAPSLPGRVLGFALVRLGCVGVVWFCSRLLRLP